jgi:uncharacterized protein with HEPN domain
VIRRHHEFRIEDILDRIRRIAIAEAQLISSASRSSEEAAEMAFDAILYNLVVIGEAVKSLDAEMKLRSPHIEWKEIIGLRDLLAHQYFQIDVAVIKASIDQPLEQVRLACVLEQQKHCGL